MLVLFCSSGVAGTIVEIQKSNELTRAIADGKKVRMNTSSSEYVIFDSSDHSVKVVNQQKQLVTQLNLSELNADDNQVNVQTSISPQGQGQTVAGYTTNRFSYMANGNNCGVLYGSRHAIDTKGVRELVSAMKVMMDIQRSALGGFASLVDACTLADMQLVDNVNTVGLPMRTEKNGKVELEVKAIRTGVALADDTFAVPATYRTVDMSGKVIQGPQNSTKAKQQTAKNDRQAQPYPARKPRGKPQPHARAMTRKTWQPGSAYPPPGYQRRYDPRVTGRY